VVKTAAVEIDKENKLKNESNQSAKNDEAQDKIPESETEKSDVTQD
jgi:hypothetical protein